MQRGSRQFKSVRASVKLGVEAMQKLRNDIAKSPYVECHNCHEPNNPKRCFCKSCKTRMIHSYG